MDGADGMTRRMPAHVVDQCIAMADQGYSHGEIARVTGYRRSTVSERVRARGRPLRCGANGDRGDWPDDEMRKERLRLAREVAREDKRRALAREGL